MPDRFPPPWTVIHNEESFAVADANGFVIAYFYFRDTQHIGTNLDRMTRRQAHAMAVNFARLPELLKPR